MVGVALVDGAVDVDLIGSRTVSVTCVKTSWQTTPQIRGPVRKQFSDDHSSSCQPHLLRFHTDHLSRALSVVADSL